VSENGDFQRKRQLAAQNPPNKAASTRNSPKKVRQRRLKNGFCKSLVYIVAYVINIKSRLINTG
jgi:hypothetical protein